MSQINSLLAYTDCERLFAAALADPKGARACVGTQDQCINLRTRMHYFRNLDRKANHNIYPTDHMLHGTSLYDPLVVRMFPDEDGKWWVYVQPRTQDMIIEGLSEVPELIDTTANEVLALENQSNGST